MGDNSLLRQKIGIPMWTDPAPCWENFFLYTRGNEYMSEVILNNKVKARHFHAIKCFIDNLGTSNDEGVFNYVYKRYLVPWILLNYN